MTESTTNLDVGSSLSGEVRRIFDVYEPLICKHCNKTFEKKTLFKAHVKAHERDDHNYEHKDKRKPRSEKSRPHVCVICNQKFTEKKNLLKHLRELHRNFNEAEKLRIKKVTCPEGNCIFACRQIRELRTHIEKHHDVKILKDTLQFASEESFLKWKKYEEDNSVSSFVSFRQPGYLRDGTLKRVLLCHRTGRYIPKGKGKHRIKSRGSCKIDGTCPAAMEIMQFPDGHLTVFYYKTHLGHSQDVAHLQLSREERAKLSEKIEQGFSLDAILEDVKDSIDPVTGKIKRIHLLSKKDLYNIMKSNSGIKKGKGSNETIGNDDATMIKDVENLTGIEGDVQESDAAGKDRTGPNDEKQDSAPDSNPSKSKASVVDLGYVSAGNETESATPTTSKKARGSVAGEKKGKGSVAVKLREKMEQIHGLLPKSEYLTPKQYETVCRKLDGVIGLLNAANSRATSKRVKKTGAERAKRKPEKAKESGKAVTVMEEGRHASSIAANQFIVAQPVYEAPLYAYVYSYN